MNGPRVLPASARWGRVGETWGNVVISKGELHVDDKIRFAEDPPGDVCRITRVNVFPPDPGKSLCYYLRVRENPTDS